MCIWTSFSGIWIIFLLFPIIYLLLFTNEAHAALSSVLRFRKLMTCVFFCLQFLWNLTLMLHTLLLLIFSFYVAIIDGVANLDSRYVLDLKTVSVLFFVHMVWFLSILCSMLDFMYAYIDFWIYLVIYINMVYYLVITLCTLRLLNDLIEVK